MFNFHEKHDTGEVEDKSAAKESGTPYVS